MSDPSLPDASRYPLESARVTVILKDCLFREEELGAPGVPPEGAVIAKGLRMSLGFHPERLESYREEVRTMLAQLPSGFHEGKGGGWSFLNAAERADGVQWGEHPNVEELLGLGLRLVRFTFPRDMWSYLPGGMPYFVVLSKEDPA